MNSLGDKIEKTEVHQDIDSTEQPRSPSDHRDKIDKDKENEQLDRAVSKRGEKIDAPTASQAKLAEAIAAPSRLAASGSGSGFSSGVARLLWVLPAAVAGAFAAVVLSARGRRRDDEPVGTLFAPLIAVV